MESHSSAQTAVAALGHAFEQAASEHDTVTSTFAHVIIRKYEPRPVCVRIVCITCEEKRAHPEAGAYVYEYNKTENYVINTYTCIGRHTHRHIFV